MSSAASTNSSEQKHFQSRPETFNGAERERYTWSQTIADLDVRIKIPQSVKKGKDVKVKISKEHIRVDLPTGTLIDADLPWPVRADESTWSLVPGECIHVSLEKVAERWWENFLVDEEKINLREIQAEKPMESLNQEEQMKIYQMMFDQRQKAAGLPTSEEQKHEEMLRKAWNVDGSPFQGQPFDPSLISSLRKS